METKIAALGRAERTFPIGNIMRGKAWSMCSETCKAPGTMILLTVEVRSPGSPGSPKRKVQMCNETRHVPIHLSQSEAQHNKGEMRERQATRACCRQKKRNDCIRLASATCQGSTKE